jgi:hypothetical protein
MIVLSTDKYPLPSTNNVLFLSLIKFSVVVPEMLQLVDNSLMQERSSPSASGLGQDGGWNKL